MIQLYLLNKSGELVKVKMVKFTSICLTLVIMLETSYAKQPDNAKVKQYIDLAENYINSGELDKAYKYLQDAESLTMNKKQIAYICEKMGEIAEKKHHYTDALLYYTRSLILAKNLQYKELESILSEKISNIQSKIAINLADKR
jgi:tetratricopeptide (TPR) repeat protein